MDCNSDGFHALHTAGYWWVHARDYWQGENVKYRRHEMACRKAETQRHAEGRVEDLLQEFTGVRGFTVCSNAYCILGHRNVATN